MFLLLRKKKIEKKMNNAVSGQDIHYLLTECYIKIWRKKKK